MHLSIMQIVFMVLGLIYVAVWFILAIYSSKYDELFEDLESDEYPLYQIYPIGYAVMELIGYGYKTSYDREMRQYLSVLYDKKYTEFYLRLTYAQAISIGGTVLCLAVPMWLFSGENLMLLIFAGFAFIATYYYLTKTKDQISERSDAMLADFSEVVSQLALLTNAGMVLREAWTQVAYTNDTEIYKEMQVSVDQMNNGLSEVEAIRQFGVRCIIPEVRKFSSTIMQGMQKGNAELVPMLMQQSDELWMTRQQNTRAAGEIASNKLLIPTIIIFVGILIMVIVPIFANLGG